MCWVRQVSIMYLRYIYIYLYSSIGWIECNGLAVQDQSVVVKETTNMQQVRLTKMKELDFEYSQKML